MEEVIAGLLEKSIVGGAFIYMLHVFLSKFTTSLETISLTLADVGDTMSRMDMRMEQMEKRITRLEENMHD